MKLSTLLLLSFLVIPALAQAKKAPSEPTMFPGTGCWGVVYQTSDPNTYAQDIPLLKKLGVQWVRLCFYWAGSEVKAKGNYDWSYSDAILEPYKNSGLKVICVPSLESLCPLYKDDKNNKELVLQAIARWYGAIAERYKGRGIVYELTNEPLHGYGMEGYWLDPKIYTRMCRLSAAAIKKADPTAKTACYSETIAADCDYIKQMLQHGILDDGTIDMIAVHPYSRPSVMPESDLSKDISWLRGMIRRYDKANAGVIVADTEKGYAMREFLTPKDSWPNRVYSRTEQAAYLARHYLTQISLGVEIAVWYKAIKGEEGFSLFAERAGTETPMAHTYRNLAHMLPENPKKLFNDKYKVTVDGDRRVVTESYLRTNRGKETLIVAMWNPIEAFDGKILESRKIIGEKGYEAWRAISPEDKVEVPVTMTVQDLARNRVEEVCRYDLLAADEAKVRTPVNFNVAGSTVTIAKLQVGPVPTVVVIELNNQRVK